MRNLLPIGSVVLLKNSKKKVMIVGLLQVQEGNSKVYDYSACIFPEGMIDPEHLYLFDNDQIDSLYFMGFQDGEGLSYMDRICHMDETSSKT